MSRLVAALLGKMSTTSVRRLISLFSRSSGLFDQDLPPVRDGEGGESKDVRPSRGVRPRTHVNVHVYLPPPRSLTPSVRVCPGRCWGR
jgi:hypothetical protein